MMMIRRGIWIGTVTLGLSLSTARAQSPGNDDLAGAWRGAVTFSSGMFAGLKGLEYMYVFNAGGTMTESSSYDGVPPVPPAYGIWRKTGPRTFEAKYQFFQTKAVKSGDELVKQGGFVPDGHGVITQSITLSTNGNAFVSNISVKMYDAEGKAISGGGSGTAIATRIRF